MQFRQVRLSAPGPWERFSLEKYWGSRHKQETTGPARPLTSRCTWSVTETRRLHGRPPWRQAPGSVFSSNLPPGPRGGGSPSLLGEGTEFRRPRYPKPRHPEVAAHAPTRCLILELKLFRATRSVRPVSRSGGQAGAEAGRRPRDPRPSPAPGWRELSLRLRPPPGR